MFPHVGHRRSLRGLPPLLRLRRFQSSLPALKPMVFYSPTTKRCIALNGTHEISNGLWKSRAVTVTVLPPEMDEKRDIMGRERVGENCNIFQFLPLVRGFFLGVVD